VHTPEQRAQARPSAQEGDVPGVDSRRTNRHYELPADFFCRITGGAWNVYSCNVWTEGIADVTASQEAKLDVLARLMDLQPGQRILDVGCGWGGPLVYLCKKYGVRGVGLTLSATQKARAEARIASHGPDAQIVLQDWHDYRDGEGFDAVYTDEAIVHFPDLGAYFEKAHSLLREGGWMVNKEVHFTHDRYKELSRAATFIDTLFGAGNAYRTLADELCLVGAAGFEVQAIEQLPRAYYLKTLTHWLANMDEQKGELIALVGADYYRRFRAYLKIAHRAFCGTSMTVDVIAARR
jgi:cyclopropane-fatty-acyl-phospholipid synthase